MDPTKWRISKACQECRLRKIRCDGGEPCQRCRLRDVSCVYREKARNRARKQSSPPSTLSAGRSQRGDAISDTAHESAAHGADSSSRGRSQSSIHNHSVAATHRTSPSVFLQLYYGPSSNFSLLNSIYHQIEGTRPTSDASKEVEEIGPGLDLFNGRRLYFGDLADVSESARMTGDMSAMLLDRVMAERLMDKYLMTYWHVLPSWSKDEFRSRLAHLYTSSEMLSSDHPDNIIVLLALAIGASILEEEVAAQSLYHKAKIWSARLDDMVNVQTVQIALLMMSSLRSPPNSGYLLTGSAVRKAVAAGLHKDVVGSGHSPEDTRQGRITVWSVYFWETWMCFSLGRPSSFPESEINVPIPTEEKLLQSLVLLARIMSKCLTRIYKHHDSLLPIWNAANETRRELRQFAEQQWQDLNFGLTGDTNRGELGVCQAMVSTMYHHTLLLTFRPFLVLRAKLRQGGLSGAECTDSPTPPAWLDTACEYCLEAARHSIAFLSGAIQQNELCRAIKYHGFFLEGASFVLAFYLLQDKAAGRANFPWIQLAIRSLQLLKHSAHPVDVASMLERMVQSVYPDFRVETPHSNPVPATLEGPAQFAANATAPGSALLYPALFPVAHIHSEESGPSSASRSPATINPEAPADLTAADLGWNFDFATMNMEAFLSIDPNLIADLSMSR